MRADGAREGPRPTSIAIQEGRPGDGLPASHPVLRFPSNTEPGWENILGDQLLMGFPRETTGLGMMKCAPCTCGGGDATEPTLAAEGGTTTGAALATDASRAGTHDASTTAKPSLAARPNGDDA